MNSIIKNKKYELVLLILIALFPIYKMAVISISIIAFFGLSVYLFFKKGNVVSRDKQKLKFFLLTTGFYFWMIFSLIYTTNVNKGLSELQHGLSLLILPLVIFFFIDRLTHKAFRIISYAFIGANFILILYLQYNFINEGLYNSLQSTTFYNLPFRDLTLSLPFKNLHPTYISMWFLFSIILLVNFFFSPLKKPSLSLKIIYITLIILFFITSVMLSSRIAIIAFIIALITYLFCKVKGALYKILVIIITGSIFFLMVFNIPFLKSRMINEFKVTRMAPPIEQTHNSVNIRVGIYQCSWHLLKNNWVTGLGVGNVQVELNNCYKKFNTDVYAKTTYNTHNQFLHIILSSGIIGLILFMLMFYSQFKLALVNKDHLYISFMVFVLICFLAENILVRIHGVLFFTYFNTLFVKRNIQNELI